METIQWSDFEKIEMRVGTIRSAERFPEARKPAYKMQIDFGAYGIKKTSAQVTDFYQPGDLVGKQVVAVVNFPVKQIGPFLSECLVLGVVGEMGVTLLHPGLTVENGLRIA